MNDTGITAVVLTCIFAAVLFAAETMVRLFTETKTSSRFRSFSLANTESASGASSSSTCAVMASRDCWASAIVQNGPTVPLVETYADLRGLPFFGAPEAEALPS